MKKSNKDSTTKYLFIVFLLLVGLCNLKWTHQTKHTAVK